MPNNSALLVSAQTPTISISVTSTASTSVALPAKGGTLRVVNEGAANVYLAVGAAAQTATVPTGTAAATATPVLASTDLSFRIDDTQVLQISAITASGTATLRVQVSEGQ